MLTGHSTPLVVALVLLSSVMMSNALAADAASAESPAPRRPVDMSYFAKADQAVADAMERHETPGAVLVAGTGDSITYRKVYGHFTYDADSFLTTQAYPNGITSTYTPDGADRLMGISHPIIGNTASFTYGRDNADQLTSVTSTGVRLCGTEPYRFGCSSGSPKTRFTLELASLPSDRM